MNDKKIPEMATEGIRIEDLPGQEVAGPDELAQVQGGSVRVGLVISSCSLTPEDIGDAQTT